MHNEDRPRVAPRLRRSEPPRHHWLVHGAARSLCIWPVFTLSSHDNPTDGGLSPQRKHTDQTDRDRQQQGSSTDWPVSSIRSDGVMQNTPVRLSSLDSLDASCLDAASISESIIAHISTAASSFASPSG